MERVPITGPQAEEKTLAVLKAGGVVVIPTDTVYGLSCDATNEAAIQKIFFLKSRSQEKSLPIFVSDKAMLERVARLTDITSSIVFQFWPGALTAILAAQPVLPAALHPGTPAVGVRIPKYPFLLEVIEKFGKPIVGTSANISGKGAHTHIENMLRDFRGASDLDLIIDAGDLPDNLPSTVVDFTKSRPVMLREGAISKNDFFAAADQYFKPGNY